MDNNSTNVGNKKKILTLAVILSAIALVVLGAGFYLFASPKTVMLQTLGKFRNNAKELLNNSSSEQVEKILNKDNVSISLKSSLSMAGQNLMDINFDYGENKKDKESSFAVDLSQQNMSLLNINGVMKDNKIFLKLKDVFDYIYGDFDYVSLFNSQKVDTDEIVDIVYDVIKKESDKLDIKKEKATIKVDDKDKKVTKLTIEYDKESMVNILKNIVNEVVKTIDGADISKDKVDSAIDSIMAEFTEEMPSLFFSSYYYGFNNVVMTDFKIDSAIVRYYFKGDVKEYSLLENDQELFTLKTEGKDNDYKITGEVSGLEFNGTYKDNELKLKLDLGLFTVDVSYTQEVKDKDGYEVDSNLVIDVQGQKISAKSNIKITDKKVVVPDLSTAKSVNELGQEDLMMILYQLQQNPLFQMFGNTQELDLSSSLNVL